MSRPAVSVRLPATVIAQALLLLVVAATLASLTRRRHVLALQPGEAPEPGPLSADFVDDFEGIVAGRSALLRVHAGSGVDRRDAVLVVERGDELNLLRPIPSPMSGGSIGFACAGDLIDDDTDFWLQTSGATYALGAPRLRTL
jgi:hypothetical protein